MKFAVSAACQCLVQRVQARTLGQVLCTHYSPFLTWSGTLRDPLLPHLPHVPCSRQPGCGA